MENPIPSEGRASSFAPSSSTPVISITPLPAIRRAWSGRFLQPRDGAIGFKCLDPLEVIDVGALDPSSPRKIALWLRRDFSATIPHARHCQGGGVVQFFFVLFNFYSLTSARALAVFLFGALSGFGCFRVCAAFAGALLGRYGSAPFVLAFAAAFGWGGPFPCRF